MMTSGPRMDNVQTLQHEFRPSPVTVRATLYVEYTIE